MSKKVVGSMSEWSGTLKDFFRQINDRSIGLGEVQAFLKHENPFGLERLVSEWGKFYQDIFGIKADFSNLQIPKKQKGFDRLIVMAQGITPQIAFDKCRELFRCWKWVEQGLDKIVKSERSAKENTYAVWFRDRVEADKELRVLHLNTLAEEEIQGITLEERLIYELKFFKETKKKHLDMKNVTLCLGSCSSGGLVPYVRWSLDELEADLINPGLAPNTLRSRQVIS